MSWDPWAEISLIRLVASSSLMAKRARDPLTRNLSTITEGVINLYVGTSLNSFSYVNLSKVTALFAFSLIFPFDHFFFFCFPAEDGFAGAAALAYHLQFKYNI